MSNRDCPDVVQRDLGLVQRALDDRNDLQQMLAGRNLRHDAAVAGMQGNLGGDDIGEHAAAVFNNGSSGFVAGAFDSQNQHG